MRTFLLNTYSPTLADMIGKEGPSRAVSLVGNFPDAETFVSAIKAQPTPDGLGATREARIVLLGKAKTAKGLSDLPPNVVYIEIGDPSTATHQGTARPLSEIILEGGAPNTPTAPATHTLTTAEALTEEGVVYTPWTDGRALGFKATASDGRVDYVILNPSGASEGSEGDVFVYASPTPNFADDGVPVTFVSLFQGDDA